MSLFSRFPNSLIRSFYTTTKVLSTQARVSSFCYAFYCIQSEQSKEITLVHNQFDATPPQKRDKTAFLAAIGNFRLVFEEGIQLFSHFQGAKS